MNEPVESIWKLLSSSGLLADTQLAALQSESRHAAGQEGENGRTLEWLVENGVISQYQAKILEAGRSGPFRFDDYVVYDRVADGLLRGSFRAHHVGSGHPVRLQFFAGNEKNDIQCWRHARDHARQIARIRHAFLITCYGPVVTDEYRFLVFDDPPGKTLFDKLPYRGRLSWMAACQAAEQIALGLREIHRAGICHAALWTGSIWIRPGGMASVFWSLADHAETKSGFEDELEDLRLYQSPLIADGAEPTIRTDLYSFGAIVYRMVSGRPPTIDSIDIEHRQTQVAALIEKCKKYDLPESLSQLLTLLLSADVVSEFFFKDIDVAAKLFSSLLGSQSLAKDTEPKTPALIAFEAALSRKQREPSAVEQPESPAQPTKSPAKTGASESAKFSGHLPDAIDFSIIRSNEVDASSKLARDRSSKQSPSNTALILGATIVSVAALLGIALFNMFSGPDSPVVKQGASPDSAQENTNDDSSQTPNFEPRADETSETTAEDKSTQTIDAALVRRVVDDDGQLVWESPTKGGPIDASVLPPAPEFMVTLRLKQLIENQNGALLLRAFGPEFETLRDRWSNFIDLPPELVERLTVSFHSSMQGDYQTFFIVDLAADLEKTNLLSRLGSTTETILESGETIYRKHGVSVYMETAASASSVDRLFFAPEQLMEHALAGRGVVSISGSMAALIKRSDTDRHINLLFLPKSLVSEEGKRLFAGKLESLRRPLHLFFDDRITAVLMSMHVDNGSYVELTFEQTVDLESADLASKLDENLRRTRDHVIESVNQLPDQSFWLMAKQRYDNMLLQLYRNGRIGIEQDRVIANCWLPPMALHNLVAVSEIALAASEFSPAVLVEQQPLPQSLEELLAAPRSIEVTSGPDLINLLNGLAAEINDDYPALGFEFRIKLLGSDLQQEGITQVQRLGDIRLSNVSLTSILTEIMVQANPDKDASGPDDPRCKLVWVIAPDPDDPEIRTILVTTRAAAARRNWALPQAFQPE